MECLFLPQISSMDSLWIIVIISAYFLMLIGVSYFTSGNGSNAAFFVGERKSNWVLVSFGMIGASLSGVTFLSVPGWVGNSANQFSYMQAVLGYLVGYVIVAMVLIPVYYKMNLVSIYQFLENRFGWWSYKTGAVFFLVSRIIGSCIRLLLVANVLQAILFDDLGVPFELTVVISILLIWVYTNKGGIKTIVWTDTLQTVFMLLSLVLTFYFLKGELFQEGQGTVEAIAKSDYSQIFFFDDFMGSNHFLKHFFGGMFITIGMTGLDQDMMQKNLSCKNYKDAQKNMIVLGIVLVVVNLIFMGLGALLYLFAVDKGIAFESPDLLFSTIAFGEHAGPLIGVLFLLGLIAAAYSSADSALTALTTSFSVDFLNIQKRKNPEKLRKRVHIIMSGVLIIVVILLKYGTNESAIGLLMKFAGFTYGPLIGLFFFGLLTKYNLRDRLVPLVALFSIAITYILWYYSYGAPGAGPEGGIFGKYEFGFELIILNAFVTFSSLFFIATKRTTS
jgi:solute:Na+ symporter, SSS family